MSKRAGIVSAILATVLSAIVLALLASLVAVRPVLRIAPSEGMREA